MGGVILKYYGIRKKLFFERLSYYFEKSKCYLYLYQPFSKQFQERGKQIYDSAFSPNRYFRHDCSIPPSKHCIPYFIICSDLISCKDLNIVKRGLKKLLLVFLNHNSSNDSIEDEINRLDRLIYHSPNSFPSAYFGPFSFKSSDSLSSKFSNFSICFRIVNSSYFSVEFSIIFSPKFRSELSSFCEKNFTYSYSFVRKVFFSSDNLFHSHKQSYYAIYRNEFVKSDTLYEKICYLKWEFFNFVQPFFQTYFHQLNIIPPSVIFYDSNVEYTDLNSQLFWTSVGIPSAIDVASPYHKDFFEYSRLFFQSSLTSRYNYIDTTSLIYVVNPSLKKHTPSYQTTQGSICLDFVDTIAPSLFLLLFLSMANRISERTIPYYRNRLNKIKLNTHSLKNCLLLRFEFEKNIAPYESLLSDSTRYSNAQLALQNLLSKRSLPSDDVYLLSNLLLSEKNSLLEQITELKNEFDKKVEILEHLVSYKRESRNLRFSWLSAITATITLYFLIYPDKTKPVALFINNLIRLITTFLFKEV